MVLRMTADKLRSRYSSQHKKIRS